MTRTDLRTKLLADTILGTDTAFDLIEEIAAIPGVKWSHAPCIGLRGSIGGAVAPTAERIRGADPETEEPFESPMDGRSLRWKEEEQALCPIAIREWHANNVDDMMILECIHTESLAQFPIRAGDHVLADRGYSTARGIRHVVDAGGRLIVRVNTGSLPLCTTAGRPFDLLAAVGSVTRPGAVRSWAITVAVPGDDGGPAGKIAGRVCVLRKSAEAIRLAHQKVRRDAARKGNQVQPATLRFAEYVIVFTTFPEPPFSAADVLEWYRLRWQVELVFKRFKSLAQLGHVPKYDDDSAKAWLYGKLFVALLVEKLIHHARAISPWGYDVPAPRPPSAWRDFKFVLNQVTRAIEPPLPLARMISDWRTISGELAEPPRRHGSIAR